MHSVISCGSKEILAENMKGEGHSIEGPIGVPIEVP